MLAARITLPHFSTLSAMSLPKLAGLIGIGTLPRSAITIWLEVRILPGPPRIPPNRDFPEIAKKPAIGGLLWLRFGLRGDRF
jgi:hypothetical protein